MATAIKTLRTLQASTSNAAGATATGTALTLTTALGGLVTALITNTSAPTVGCDFVVEVSGDNTNWKEFSRQTAPITASTAFPFVVEVPASVMYLRSKFTGNTGQSVTVESFLQELTSVG